MQVELVRVQTPDGVRLDGGLVPAGVQSPSSSPASSLPLDALLLLHGTGSNFYGSSLLVEVAREASSVWGLNVLLANTRGHDIVYAAATADGRRLLGAAYEAMDDCRHDIAAWIDLLAERGMGRIALAGHSLGALKTIYSQAVEPRAEVKCVICLSPPRLAYSLFKESPRSSGFLEELARAQQLVDKGRGDALMEVRFPIPYVVTAASYVDKYGPGEHYDLLKFVARVPQPLLFTYGSSELGGMAFRGVPEQVEAVGQAGGNVQVAVVAGADHNYSGTRGELLVRVSRWLRRLG